MLMLFLAVVGARAASLLTCTMEAAQPWHAHADSSPVLPSAPGHHGTSGPSVSAGPAGPGLQQVATGGGAAGQQQAGSKAARGQQGAGQAQQEPQQVPQPAAALGLA